jgi:hypothetical protein
MVIHSVGSMPRFLQGQAEAGWAVVGAAVGDDAKDCASYQMQQPTVLVMGAPRPPLPSTQPGPFIAARCNGVAPSAVVTSLLTPSCISTFTASTCPLPPA